MRSRFILFLLFFHFAIESPSQLLKEPHSATEVQQWYRYLFRVGPADEQAFADSMRTLHLKVSILIFKDHFPGGGGDCGKEKTHYDKQGRATKDFERKHSKTTGKQTLRSVNTYSANGKQSTSSSFRNGKLISTNTSFYDDKGRLIRSNYNLVESGKGSTEYFYTHSGKILQVITNYYGYRTTTDVVYDTKEQPISKVVIRTDSLGKSDTVQFAQVKYDSLGRIVFCELLDYSEAAFNAEDSSRVNYYKSQCTFTYDKDGMLVKKTDTNYFCKTSIYTYTNDHRLLTEDGIVNDSVTLRRVHYYSGMKDSLVIYRILLSHFSTQPVQSISEWDILIYNSNGKVISLKRFSKGFPSLIEGEEYTYDDYGNLTGSTRINVDFQTGKITLQPNSKCEYNEKRLNKLFIIYLPDGTMNMDTRYRYKYY